MGEFTVNILRNFLHRYHVLVVVPSIFRVVGSASCLCIRQSKVSCWRPTVISFQPLNVYRSDLIRLEIRITIWITDNRTFCVGIYPRPRLHLDVNGTTFFKPFRHIRRVQRLLPKPAPRIDPSCRIGSIRIQIVATQQPDRIVVNEPAYIRGSLVAIFHPVGGGSFG